MTISKVPLLKGDTRGIEADWRDALPENMYPVIRSIMGADGYMHAYPGVASFANATGVDRGGMYNDRQGNHYRVSGQELVSVSASGVVASLGAVPGDGQAAMTYSFQTQCVVAGGNMFLYDPSAGFRQVVDSDLGDPIDVVWVDGYYFLTDGEFIYHTDITDESSIDPLKFATAEFMPDASLGVSKTQDNKVMVWGRYTLEYFVNVATANFAFQRLDTRAQKIGIVATHAKTEASGVWYIVGGRKEESVSVHAVNVGSAQKIATREIDKILEQYTEPELSDIRVESRIEKNTTFIIIHLPNETLCYIPSVNAWCILKTGITGQNYHRCINGVFDPRQARWVYGDRIDGRLGLLDESIFTQYDDEPQEWVLYSPFLRIERQSIDEIEIDTLPGDGVSDDDDATVFLSLTYNGKTYGTEIRTDYGARYDYEKRFIKRRLGYVNEYVGFKFRGATRSRMSFGLFRLTHG